jgi:hypothetical protein
LDFAVFESKKGTFSAFGWSVSGFLNLFLNRVFGIYGTGICSTRVGCIIKEAFVPVKKNLFAALTIAAFVSFAFAAEQEQPTPYDLIRPVYPLTWDTTVFDHYDTTVTKKHNVVPKRRIPSTYIPNNFVPDTLDQAYLDAMNSHISPIRVNQAGY